MTPNFTTIVTPLDPDRAEACRQYLRDNADPYLLNGAMQCRPLFSFDRITTLHFCSFAILEEDEEFGPRLVFEATFDGSREDFLGELLDTAPIGMRAVYCHCAGYSPTALAAPEITKEYLICHDVGANTFFTGSPGRTVAQIKGESRLRSDIVTFLSNRWPIGSRAPARSAGYLEAIRREVISGRGRQPLGRATRADAARSQFTQRDRGRRSRCSFHPRGRHRGRGRKVTLLRIEPAVAARAYRSVFRTGDADGRRHQQFIVSWLPWLADFVSLQPVILDLIIALSILWLLLRTGELFLSSASENPRSQSFVLRFPLHLLIIFRYALLVFLGGAVVLAILSGTAASRTGAGDVVASFQDWVLMSFATIARFVLAIVILVVLSHWASTLRLAVQLRPLDMVRENIRRLKLDLCEFGIFLTVALGALLIMRHFPLSIGDSIADFSRLIVYFIFVVVAYALIGVLTAYAVGFILFALIFVLETRDRSNFVNPAGLIIRARENAAKFSREEGGINNYQNHLASVTQVKPGIARRWLLRLALFAVDVLSRFWFNRGELGGIPTILSARWVLIDEGRRLLFLDNYGGAWESYLNEFIDMPAVKGLNAIWSNTFVRSGGRSFGFPQRDSCSGREPRTSGRSRPTCVKARSRRLSGTALTEH